MIEATALYAFLTEHPKKCVDDFYGGDAPEGTEATDGDGTRIIEFYDGLVRAWVTDRGTRYNVSCGETRFEMYPNELDGHDAVLVYAYTYCDDCEEEHLQELAALVRPSSVAFFMGSWTQA
jgi:hypothetical protein